MGNSTGPPVACGACGGKGMITLKDGIWRNNPISIQILGICSALAVTNRFENALVMGVALIFVATSSNVFVSLLRNITPRRIRMMAEMAVIATSVIVFDQFLKAFYWDMSKQLGPYVGLIITNCIVMGRAEAFALQNPPVLSVVDGLANGLGYAVILAVIGFFRELLGTGKVLLFEKWFDLPLDISVWYERNLIMIMAPGAFVALGFLIALFNVLKPPEPEDSKP
jgi:Na+-transporting NADH:ubiquinone oxidoreductase subunit D